MTNYFCKSRPKFTLERRQKMPKMSKIVLNAYLLIYIVKFFKILDFIANIQIYTIHITQPIISLRAKLKRNFSFRTPGIAASFMSFLSFALCYINTTCDYNITNNVYFIIYL